MLGRGLAFAGGLRSQVLCRRSRPVRTGALLRRFSAASRSPEPGAIHAASDGLREVTWQLSPGIAILASEFRDMRNSGSGQFVAFGAFLVAGLGLVALVVMGVKAIGSEGRHRSAWLILMVSLTFGLVAPLPVLFDVTTSGSHIRCGHPFLAQPDIDASLHHTDTNTAWAASACEIAFSSRRSLAAKILSVAVALALGAVVVLVWPRSARQAPDLRAAGSVRG